MTCRRCIFYAFSSPTARFFDESIPTILINLYSAFSTFLGSCVLVLQSHTPVATLQDWMFFLLTGNGRRVRGTIIDHGLSNVGWRERQLSAIKIKARLILNEYLVAAQERRCPRRVVAGEFRSTNRCDAFAV